MHLAFLNISDSLEDAPAETRPVTPPDNANDDEDDDRDSILSLPWTFSPLVNIISPLPPSPAPRKVSSLYKYYILYGMTW